VGIERNKKRPALIFFAIASQKKHNTTPAKRLSAQAQLQTYMKLREHLMTKSYLRFFLENANLTVNNLILNR